jgi:hypothetical protein
LSNTIALLLGVLVGLTTGWVCERLPVVPVLQTTGAGLLGVLLGTAAAAILWLVARPPAVEIKAVSFGLFEGLLVLVASGAVGATLHYGLGKVASSLHWPTLAAHRAIIVSVIGGVCGVLSFVAGSGMVKPMGR